ncbi:MAG: hypothetical protein ACK41U_12395 [Paracoccus sp. (in: a-proteobacteria)]|uniref:hypothetical protein n=1 Tax=Paracoccus sp. TaxID=267 RepID=UPI00391CFF80
MAHQNRIAAMRFTLGLAMRAKLATPDVTALRLAVIAVDKSFEAGDPLRVSLHEFADQFPRVRRDPPALQQAGDVLFDAVRRATWPASGVRADIEG